MVYPTSVPRFFWDDLLDCVTVPGRVVPVIGSELLMVPGDDGVAVPFSTRLAQRCAGWLRERYDLELADDASLPVQMKAAQRHGADFSPALYAAHQTLLAELTDADLPHALRLLAQIHDFPFFVSTTSDGLLAKALGIGAEKLVAAELEHNRDLPLGWQPKETPKLFQLFGRIAAGSDGAITEEDTLEYLTHLHDQGRPARLLSHLRGSHLLFIGNQFPDWLTRMLLRLLRGDRFFGGRKTTFDAVADPEARNGGPLVGFLRAFSPRTRVYEDGDSASFVKTLYEKWRDRTGSPVVAPEFVVRGMYGEAPAPMKAGSIFISYASEDRSAAERLARALDTAGLDVWLDRRQLQGGDNYGAKIAEHIRQCRLFVPLMSRQTVSRHEGYFRREWLLARERLEMIGPELSWVMPVVIDEVGTDMESDLQRYFELPGHSTHVLRCLGGDPGEAIKDFVEKFRSAVRQRAA